MVDDKPLGPLAGPAFDVFDPRFAACVLPDEKVERLWTGGKWTEGPAWLADRQMLVWSDIPGNRLLAWSEATGEVSPFRHPSHGGNGNTVDRQGRLVTCEQYTRRITRTEADGSVTVLVDNFEGKRFNAPNDIVVKSDGSIWFTDPDYGHAPEYEGERELAGCHVYRLDPDSAEIRQMTEDFVMPNGLAFSPDETLLYVIDTGSTHIEGGPNHVRRFRVGDDATLSGGEVLATNAAKKYDGLRVDTEARLWLACEDGIECRLPDGKLIGKVRLPERASNLTFGGQNRDRLLITATTSVYAYRVNARGASA